MIPYNPSITAKSGFSTTLLLSICLSHCYLNNYLSVSRHMILSKLSINHLLRLKVIFNCSIYLSISWLFKQSWSIYLFIYLFILLSSTWFYLNNLLRLIVNFLIVYLSIYFMVIQTTIDIFILSIYLSIYISIDLSILLFHLLA